MHTIKKTTEAVRELWLVIFVFVGGVALITPVTGCGGEARDSYELESDGGTSEDTPIEQETFYHYPAEHSEEPIEIGTAVQGISAIGFMGWRGESVDQRGRLCAGAPSTSQLCIVPALKANKFHIEPVGFTAADYDQVVNGFLGAKIGWAFLGIEALGWTWTQGTATDYTVRIMAGNVSGSAYPADDVRRWVHVACEAMSAQLTEPVALNGTWHRCGKITIRVDVNDMFSDGANASLRTARLQQAGALGMVWGVGLGIGNIDPGTIFQRQSAQSFLGVGISSRSYCALETYSLGSKTEIRKLDPLVVCN